MTDVRIFFLILLNFPICADPEFRCWRGATHCYNQPESSTNDTQHSVAIQLTVSYTSQLSLNSTPLEESYTRTHRACPATLSSALRNRVSIL